MILIFGGVYQGKLGYALGRFGLSSEDVYYCNDEDVRVPCGKRVIYEFEKWVLSLVKADRETDKAVREFIMGNNDAIVICNDISCGIVPIDPIQRKWREAAGRALALLACESDEAIRLFCGIPTVITR